MKRLIVIMAVIAACPSSALAEHAAFKFGHPDTGKVIEKQGYALSYDGWMRSARWVAEKLTEASLTKNIDRPDPAPFASDKTRAIEYRAGLKDYRSSGFDRGHLAPSGNHQRDADSNKETFLLSNMSPQRAKFNQGYWCQLETAVRTLAKKPAYKAVYVFTGPLFVPYTVPKRGEGPGPLSIGIDFLGTNHVPIPSHYFKAVLAIRKNNKREMWAFVLPNRNIYSSTKLSKFQVSTDHLEHLAGFNLWSKLPKTTEKKLERAKMSLAVWGTWPTKCR